LFKGKKMYRRKQFERLFSCVCLGRGRGPFLGDFSAEEKVEVFFLLVVREGLHRGPDRTFALGICFFWAQRGANFFL